MSASNSTREVFTHIDVVSPYGNDSSDFSPDEIALVLNKSPAINLQIFQIKNDTQPRTQPRWTIDLENCVGKDVSEYFGSDTVDSMLRKLGGRATDGGSMEVEEYSKLCSAIWHFRVIPDEIDVARQVMAKKPDAEQLPALYSDDQHTLTEIVRDTQPWPLPRRNGIETKGPKSWCWNRKPRGFRERAHQLANVSLVLGWKEVFKTEIERMVWDWSRTTSNQDMTRTPLECLRPESLDERRKTELAKVKLFLENHTKQSSTPPYVRNSLKVLLEANPSSADDNVYNWMRSVQDSCWRPGWSNAQASPRSHQIRAQSDLPTRSRTSLESYRHLPRQGRSFSPPQGRALAWLHCWLTKELNKNRVFVETMLSAVNERIEDSQKKIVDEMMQWRNKQVDDWKMLMGRSVANEGAGSGSSRESLSVPTIQNIQEMEHQREIRERVNEWEMSVSFATALDRRESPISSVNREVRELEDAQMRRG